MKMNDFYQKFSGLLADVVPFPMTRSQTEIDVVSIPLEAETIKDRSQSVTGFIEELKESSVEDPDPLNALADLMKQN